MSKKSDWYRVQYKGDDGYFHDDRVRGLTEAKRLAKYYNVGYEKI